MKEKNLNLCKNLSDQIKNTINDYNYSARDIVWNKHLKEHIINSFEMPILISIIKSKDSIKNMNLNEKEIIKIFDEFNLLDIKKIDNNDNNDFKFEKFSFNEVNKLKHTIINSIIEINEKTKHEVINEYKKLNLDLRVLELIYNSINKLEEMDECYICFSKINNFKQLKIDMKNKISKLYNDYSVAVDLENLISEWDLLLNSSLIGLYKENKLNEIIYKIEDDWLKYTSEIEKFIIDLKNKIEKEENINLKNIIIQNLEKIEKLEKDRMLKNIKEEDVQLFKIILNDIIGLEKLKIDINSSNFINIETLDNPLPFSDGEKRIISLLFSILFFMSSKENYKDLILLLDDIDDFLDALNRINLIHILKTFTFDYDLNFFISTHNNILIKEIWDSGIKKINIFLLNKNINTERMILSLNSTNTTKDVINFLGYSSGIKLFKEKVIKNFNNWNKSDKFFILLYSFWLIRTKEMIWNNQKNIPNLIETLKYENLFINSDESRINFNSWLNEFKLFIGHNDLKLINYNEFNEFCNLFKNNIKNINIKNDNFPPIIKLNIINTIKIAFLREILKNYIENLISENKSNMSIFEMIRQAYDDGKITFEKRKVLIYLWNFFCSFHHNEIMPSLLLNGIELNENIINKIIDIMIEWKYYKIH